MIRIMHVLHRLDYGGLENGVVNLVNRMPRDGFEHVIVALGGINPRFQTRVTNERVLFVDLHKRSGKDYACYGRMASVLHRYRPDIVHTRNLGTIDMQWVAAITSPAVRVHGEHGWEASDPDGTDRRSLRIRRACRPVIQAYVPMSQDIARWLERSVGVEPGRIWQIYSGVDTDRFHPAARVHDGRPQSGFVIGTVGRLNAVKHQSLLLETLAALRRNHPALAQKMRLVLVGDGPEGDRLRQLADRLGCAEAIDFLGARDDTAELMRSFDVFVLPSLNEGISNTILEAMATGLPVVATAVGGNPELVQDGTTGLLTAPGDSSALQEALMRYLQDPALAAAHGQAGRERACKYFSLAAMTGTYAALYEKLTDGRRSTGAARHAVWKRS